MSLDDILYYAQSITLSMFTVLAVINFFWAELTPTQELICVIVWLAMVLHNSIQYWAKKIINKGK